MTYLQLQTAAGLNSLGYSHSVTLIGSNFSLMKLRSQLPLFSACAFILITGCALQPDFIVRHEPWRHEVELACLHSGGVRQVSYVSALPKLKGPKPCGAVQPFEVAASAGGSVALDPPARLRCPMIPAVDRWIRHVVQPAANRLFGQPIVSLKVIASYSCRPMNNKSGDLLSEHGYANAIDISSFTLANGRKVAVKTGWRGYPKERAFLRAVHGGACRVFTTVLGPNHDSHHQDHFHLDLARHGRRGDRRICK